ncbi:hypothetical protein GY45DRAFT_756158 [Cubamyces sp. BRFM 1775]|nr:hypothetical protein GY45DRAFT_756158 [Cubamyces sp. BRFM 1775]
MHRQLQVAVHSPHGQSMVCGHCTQYFAALPQECNAKRRTIIDAAILELIMWVPLRQTLILSPPQCRCLLKLVAIDSHTGRWGQADPQTAGREGLQMPVGSRTVSRQAMPCKHADLRAVPWTPCSAYSFSALAAQLSQMHGPIRAEGGRWTSSHTAGIFAACHRAA